jgi:hypothetical protein
MLVLIGFEGRVGNIEVAGYATITVREVSSTLDARNAAVRQLSNVCPCQSPQVTTVIVREAE